MSLAVESGINKKFAVHEERVPVNEHLRPKEGHLNIHLLVEEAIQYQPIFLLYAAAQETAKKITRTGLEILAVPPDSIARNGVLVHTSAPNECKIYLKSSLENKEALVTLILELANVLFLEKYDKIFEEAAEGRVNKQEFVYQIESTEFNIVKIFDSVMEKLKLGWPGVWDECPDGFSTLEEYIEKQQESGHVQEYENLWEDRFSKIFNKQKNS
jgi:hypothetical protein